MKHDVIINLAWYNDWYNSLVLALLLMLTILVGLWLIRQCLRTARPKSELGWYEYLVWRLTVIGALAWLVFSWLLLSHHSTGWPMIH